MIPVGKNVILFTSFFDIEVPVPESAPSVGSP